jgi:hypothetical protein
MALGSADGSRRSAVALSSLLVATSVVFGGVPVAYADPIDDDTSTESVDAAPEPEAPEPEPEPEAPVAAPDAPEPGPAADEPGPGPDASEPDAPQQDSPGADEPGGAPEAPGAPEPPANEPQAPANEPGSGEPPNESPAPANPPDHEDTSLPDLGDEDPITPDLNTADTPVSDADEQTAENGKAVEVDPGVASTAEIDDLREIVDSQFTSTSSTSSSSSTTVSSSWNQSVTSWSSSWVSYDTYYRPVIINPYQYPLQVVYTYDNAPRIVMVNPLERVVVDAKTPGVYSFTALTMSPDKKSVSTASVGSFSGGGYKPAPGQPPPAKPVSPNSFENVLVQLRYTEGNSKPFRVKKLYDLGDDPSVGARRVLLDGEVPAWGQWTKTSKGEQLFAINKTEQLPGLNPPSQGPLPGYKVDLVAREESTKHSVWSNVWLWVGIAAAGVVVVGGIVFTVVTQRRKKVG